MRTDERERDAASQKYLAVRNEQMTEVKKDWPWLDFGTNYVAHDYQFDSPDFFNFLKKRKYATYHGAQMDGYVPRTANLALLDAQLAHRIYTLIADQTMIANLMKGRTNDGAPLAMKDDSSGYKPVGLKEFRVVDPDALEKLRANGFLQRCLDAGSVFESQSGAYVELIEIYVHPNIAADLKKRVENTYADISAEWKRDTRKPSVIRRALNFMSSKARSGENRTG